MGYRNTDHEAIKRKYGVDRLWSFSRVNSYIGCPYSYFLKYVKKVKEQKTSIYSVLGSEFHDILEKYYNDELAYEEMADSAEAIMLHVNVMDMKFDYSDAEKNKKMQTKYFECVRHFFKNYKPLKAKILTEKEVTILVGLHAFFGFIDSVHKDDDGNYIITDYKSSTAYRGEKILKEGRQLLLYALGLNQAGIPLDKIKCQWNFLKYCDVSYEQKNGKTKTSTIERSAIIDGLESRIKMALKDNGVDEFEIADLLSKSIRLNDFSLLPDYVEEAFTIEDCYVQVPVTQANIDTLVADISKAVEEILVKESEYFEDESKEDIWFKTLTDRDTFFCSNLCGYTSRQCICYKTYLDNRDMFKVNPEETGFGADNDWMKEVGLV
jgi:RecB family exonuclease